MSSKYKCIGVPMTELPRPSTTDKYSGIGSSLSGMISYIIITFIKNLFLFGYILGNFF